MNNRRFGAFLMILGLLFITAAFSLYGYNRSQERKAGEASVSALEEVSKLLLSQDAVEREVVVLEDQELPPENTLAAPGSMPSYVSEREIAEQQENASKQETADQKNVESQPAMEDSSTTIPDPEKTLDAAAGQASSVQIEEKDTEPMPEGVDSPENPTAEEESAAVEPTAEKETSMVGSASGETAPTTKPSSSLDNTDSTSMTGNSTVPMEETVPQKPLPDYLLHPEIEMPEKEINGVAYIGTLEIPKLSLSLPIMSSWSYTQLNYAPCRYNGSAYTDDFVLIAHNYATHFGRIKELRSGDQVIFTDMSGNVLCYEVAETETLERDDVEKLIESGYALTLMTCTIGGRTRVAVRCDRVLD